MATVDQLVIELRAKTAQFEQGMKSAEKSTKQLSAVAARAQTAVAGLVGVMGAREVLQYADTYKQLSGKLTLVTKNADDTAASFEKLFSLAQETRQPLEATVAGYSRLSMSLNDSQKATTDLMKFTELLNKTLAISGASASGAKTFFEQFGQAASSDFKSVGQELMTFADQNPRFYKIINDEAVKSGQTIKQMAADGKLSFDFISNALSKSAASIESDFQKIPKTIGQALTQVDNAFLKYIGQSDAVAAGTGSVTSALTALANNFELVGDTAAIVAAVISIRYAASLGTALAETIALRAATFTLSGSVATLGRSMLVAFGNPVGLAIAAVAGSYYLLGKNTDDATAAAERYEGVVKRLNDIGSVRNQQNIEAVQREKELIEMHINKARAMIIEARELDSLIDKTAKYLKMTGNPLMLATALGLKRYSSAALGDEEAAQAKNLEALKAVEEWLNRPIQSGKSSPMAAISSGAKGASKNVNKLQDELDEISRTLSLESMTVGMTDVERKTAELDNRVAELTKRYGKLSQAQLEQVAIDRERIKAIDEANRKQEETRAFTESMGNAFSDAFEKAALGADSFSNVLDGLLKQIQSILFRQVVGNPLSELLQGTNGSGGIIGSILGTGGKSGGSSLFSGFMDFLPSFDVGTNNVPKDMIAQVHQGEMIVPKYDAERMRNGGMGGGNVSINVINNSSAKVQAASSPNAGGGTDISIMIDEAVANNIGQRGSRTSQALNAFNSQSLVRR